MAGRGRTVLAADTSWSTARGICHHGELYSIITMEDTVCVWLDDMQEKCWNYTLRLIFKDGSNYKVICVDLYFSDTMGIIQRKKCHSSDCNSLTVRP